MDAAADAFLALPGGLGTLEELSEVWVAAVLGMHAKPVVVLDPGGLFASLRDLVVTLEGEGFVRRAAAETVVWAGGVGEALDAIEVRLGAPARAPSASEAIESAP
jgi:predicted Rossmann-fold nucleotide-binding protein